MPVRPEGGGDGQSDGMVTIPKKDRAQFRAGGYYGPWTMTEDEASALIRDLTQGGGDGGGEDQSTVDTVLDILGGLLGGDGGGSSGSGGLTAAQKKQRQRQRRQRDRALHDSFVTIIKQWGLDFSDNLKNLIELGVSRQWGTTSFLLHLRKTAEYKQMYPGIKGPDGVRMSEAQYNSMYNQFVQELRHTNFNLSRQMFGGMVEDRMPLAEWRMRVGFLERATRNRDFFQQLEKTAQARGIIDPKQKFNARDLYMIMTHRASPEVEKLLEEANVRHQLKSVGFTVGKRGAIARSTMLDFVRTIEGQGGEAEALTSKSFANLAKTARTVLPAAKLIGAGITKEDLFTLEFGGDRQNEIARHVQGILESNKLEEQPNVNPVLIEDEGGSRLLSGTIKRSTGL
jgi:hypothetical protein